MHSRIFQMDIEPINKKDYIDESTFYEDTFIGTIADYVDEDTNRDEDIQWLVDCYEKYGMEYNKEEDYVIFKKGFKKNYFRERFKLFKETIDELTFEDFAYDTRANLYKIKSLMEDRFSFYVYFDDYWMTFDRFVRQLEEDKKYYLGATIDYHA